MFFFFFTRPNEGARKIGRVSDVLRAPALPIGIERAICPGLYYQIKVILSYVIGIYIYFIYFQPDLYSAGPTMAMKEGKK